MWVFYNWILSKYLFLSSLERELVLGDLPVDGAEEGDADTGLPGLDPGVLEMGFIGDHLHFAQHVALLHINIVIFTDLLDQLLAHLQAGYVVLLV